MVELRPLVLGPEAQEKANRVVAYAMDHPYRPGGKAAPGDNPNFVVMLDTYRCVFTFTHIPQSIVFRHLSISVPSEKYPHPIAAFEIARLFGFTGYDEGQPMRPGDGWAIQTNEAEHCMVIVQETK